MPFDHDRYPVYNLALAFVALSEGICADLSPDRARLSDQLARVATDIAVHIAQGAADHSRPGRRRQLLLARVASSEGAAILDVCERVGALDAERHGEGKRQLQRLATMLGAQAAALDDAQPVARVAVAPWYRTGSGGGDA